MDASEISPLFLVWITSTASLQVGIDSFEIRRHVVAILRVVGHDKQDRLSCPASRVRVALAPFNHAQMEVVGVFLGDTWRFGAPCSLARLAASGSTGCFTTFCADRLDQRIVANRLHEDRAVVVPRRRRHIHLQGQRRVLLQQPVVNVLNRLEPGHATVVDVVRLVVEHGQLVDLAHDHAEVDLAVGGLPPARPTAPESSPSVSSSSGDGIGSSPA